MYKLTKTVKTQTKDYTISWHYKHVPVGESLCISYRMVFDKCNFSAAVTSKDKSTLIGGLLSCDPVTLKSPFLMTEAMLRSTKI